MTEPLTFVTLAVDARRETSLASRFAKTFRANQRGAAYSLPHPTPLASGGTTPHALHYALGHSGAHLEPVTHLSPELMRQLRHVAYELKQERRPLHLFSLVDDWSPFGSSRLLESVVRFFLPLRVPIVVHLLCWHPTPRELRRCWDEVKSLPGEVQIGSVGSLFLLDNEAYARDYLAALIREADPDLGPPVLPISRVSRQPSVCLEPYHKVLLLGHGLSALTSFKQVLDDYCQFPSTWEEMGVPRSAEVDNYLDRGRHVIALSPHSDYLNSFFGYNLSHPYFESLTTRTSSESLELLLAPDFEYRHSQRLFVFLDEEDNTDWLLATLLAQHVDRHYILALLSPHDLKGNVVLTTRPYQSSHPYESLNPFIYC